MKLNLPERTLTPGDLQDCPVIALSQESFHHASIEDWFHSGNAHCLQIDTCKSLGVAASLAASGLGVTLLPVKCFQVDLALDRLRIIDATPVFPRIKFMATCARNSFNRLTRRVALLAQQVSDY